VLELRDRFGVSERRACRSVRQHRSSQRYCRTMVPDEAALRERLQALARRYPRYGYRRIHVPLVRDGWRCNRKRIQRLWRDEGLRVPAETRRRKKGRRAPGNVVAHHPDHVWAMDFEFDQTQQGRPIKILNITDEFTRECLASVPARQINADRVVSVLEELVEWRAKSRLHPLRQRPRTRRRSPQRLVPLHPRGHLLHRTRCSLAESSLRRVLQRTPTTRTARTRILQHALRSPGAHRRLAPRIQPLPTTHVARIPDPSNLRPHMADDRPPTRPSTLIRSGPKNGVRSLAYAQAVNGQQPRPLEKFHVPVGGRRFRPSLEDFIEFLHAEKLLPTLHHGWREVLAETRGDWLRRQLQAAVRNDPDIAAEQLVSMGYEVTGPAAPGATVIDPHAK
jgi:hypothetical protein